MARSDVQENPGSTVFSAGEKGRPSPSAFSFEFIPRPHPEEDRRSVSKDGLQHKNPQCLSVLPTRHDHRTFIVRKLGTDQNLPFAFSGETDFT